MENNQLHNPLVSIIVITYNSSKFVLETLESAKAQTYQNIELIVSDDCSTDDTVEICRKWLDKNSKQFVRTELVTTDKNTGISANCNRGVKAAKGEWLKLIAGDDILLKHCVETMMFAVSKELNDVSAFFGLSLGFLENYNDGVFIDFLVYDMHKKLNYASLEEQKKILFSLDIGINGPGIMIKRVDLEKIGYYDEQYKLLEDYPIFIKFLKNNYRIGYLDEVIVHKRRNSTSVSNAFTHKKVYSDYMKYWFLFVRKELFSHLSLIKQVGFVWNYSFFVLTIFLGNKGRFLFLLKKVSSVLQPRGFTRKNNAQKYSEIVGCTFQIKK